MASRKLQAEIDRVLKQVRLGIEEFGQTWEKVQTAPNQNLKDKHEADLKKEIKKLQRHRDQIKTWASSSEVKNKKPLLDARKDIETEMERFKVLEKESKTKAYSKEGLLAAAKQQSARDPTQDPNYETLQWIDKIRGKLRAQLTKFEKAVDTYKANTKKKDHEEFKQMLHWIDRHNWHLEKLRRAKARLVKERIDKSAIEDIQDDVEFYVSDNQDPDFFEDEALYDVLDERMEEMGQEDVDEDDMNEVDEDDDYQLGSDAELSEEEEEEVVKPKKKEDKKGKKGKATSAAAAPAPTTPVLAPAAAPQESKEVDAEPAAKAALPQISANYSPAPTPTKPKKSQEEKKIPQTQTPQQWSKISAPASASSSSSSTTTAAPSSSSAAPAKRSSAATAAAAIAAVQIPPKTAAATVAAAVAASSSKSPVATSQTAAPSPKPSTPAASPSTATAPAKADTLASIVKKQEAPPSQPNATPSPASSVAPAAASSSAAPLSSLPASALHQQQQHQQHQQQQPSAPPSASPAASFLSSLTPPSEAVHEDLDSLLDVQQHQAMLLDSALDAMPDPFDSEWQYIPRNPYRTPPYFPSHPVHMYDDPAVYERFSLDTLFFIFYYQQGTPQQYLAARELKRQSWRYHKSYLLWFQRHDDPKLTTEDYEQGTYIYFDYESGWCQRIKGDFTFEYRHLEDELLIPPAAGM